MRKTTQKKTCREQKPDKDHRDQVETKIRDVRWDNDFFYSGESGYIDNFDPKHHRHAINQRLQY